MQYPIDMTRALQLYSIVKMGIPGITHQQLADFMLAQSAERQTWFKTASMMDLADWIVAEMREQNYAATVKRQAERESINDMFGGNAGAAAPRRDSTTSVVREAILEDYAKNAGQKKTQQPTKEVKNEKCKVCGEEITSSSFTCQNCGNTQWGFVIGFIIFSIFLVLADFSLFQNHHPFWGVVMGLVTFIVVVVTGMYVWDAIKIPASLKK